MKARITITKCKAALLSVALLFSLALIPAAPVAQRFVATYQALGASPEPLSAWERITFSYLLLRGGDAPRAEARVR